MMGGLGEVPSSSDPVVIELTRLENNLRGIMLLSYLPLLYVDCSELVFSLLVFNYCSALSSSIVFHFMMNFCGYSCFDHVIEQLPASWFQRISNSVLIEFWHLGFLLLGILLIFLVKPNDSCILLFSKSIQETAIAHLLS